MAKISDIWVKLGLKKEGFDKGMDDAGKKADSLKGKFDKFKAGAVAVWAAVGAAAVAAAKNIFDSFINTTNAVGDAWNRFIAQSKAGWATFIQSISAWNWDNFIGRLREATNAAKELQNALDAEFEVSNSIRLQKAAMAEELSQLELLIRDSSKPYEERAEAARKYLAMVKPLYDQEIRLANKLLDAQQGAWLAGSGLTDSQQTRDDLGKFLVDYGRDEGLASALAGMMELQDKISVAKTTQLKSGNFEYFQKLIDGYLKEFALLEDYVREFASANNYSTDIFGLAKVYEKLRGDADTQPLVEALIRALTSKAGYNSDNRRINTMLSSFIGQIGGPGQPVQLPGVEDAAREMAESLEEEIGDIDLILPEIDDTAFQKSLENVSAHVDGFISDWEAEQQRIAELNGMLIDAIVASMSNGIQAITDMMAGLEGVNASQVLGALMQPLADTAIQLGEMLVAQGIGVEAFKKSLQSLEGAEAIAAGAALIAIGSAMRSGIQALASGGGASSTATSYSGGSASGEVENYEQTLTVYVEGKISGSDIVLAGNKTMNRWGR